MPRIYRKELYNSKEASNYLCLSLHTIYKLTSQRLISFVKIGNRCFFKKEQLDDFINKRIIKVA